MMKKLFLPLAAVALLAASCDNEHKDSYYTTTYVVFNVVTDTQNPSELAQLSDAVYALKHNVTRDVFSFTESGLSLNGQKISFETDEMNFTAENFKLEVPDQQPVSGSNILFSSKQPNATGASIQNFNGKIGWVYVPDTSDLSYPNFQIGVTNNFSLSYSLNDRFFVQTFNPYSYFLGTTVEKDDTQTNAYQTINYMVEISLVNKNANIYVYNRTFRPDGKFENPQVMKIKDVPIVLTHSGFYLSAAAPATQVRIYSETGLSELKEDPSYKVTDFEVYYLSSDYSEARISYKVAGKEYSFQGSCAIKGTPVN